MKPCFRQLFITCMVAAGLLGCGGGGGSAAPGVTPAPIPVPTPPPVTPPTQLPVLNSITLHSDAGDVVGQGQSYHYSAADAKITVTAQNNRLVVQVEGDEQWTGVFQTGGNATELKVGEYRSLERWVENLDAAKGGLTWWAYGRTCQTSTGWIAIDNVTYASGHLVSIALRFQRHCNGSAAALRGELKYTVNDKTAPTPVGAPPGGLWRPPATVTASVGNYAYFESADGDYVGLGKTYLFDRHMAVVEINGSGESPSIVVRGDDIWAAELRGLSALQRLNPGYYPGVKAARFSNPVKGGMSWTGAGRGCSQSTGWFAVDAVAYDDHNRITVLDLRFEQHCEGREAPLRGAVRYRRATDVAVSPVHSNAGSWRAPPGLIPLGDNFLYVQGEPNEPLGNGVPDLLTSRNAAFEVSTDGNSVQLYGKGNRTWSVQFRAPARFAQVVPGSYDAVTTPPGDSAAFGALYVTADSYGCNTSKGWVVVDSASYVGGKLAAIELRFEQFCAGGNPNYGLLRGHLRWRAGVPSAFPGPAAAPDLFWRADIAVPAGSYVYMTSDRSDFLGNGRTLFTPVDSEMQLTEKDGKVDVALRGDTIWHGTFETMSTAGKVLPGYYAGLKGSLRPARGSFRWGGDGRGCNTATSGVVVDNAVYVNGRLSELELRFEQHCNDEPGAMRGQLRWLASDTRQPAGPRMPPPASLWRAPAGALPAAGNYLYIQSGPGESIGGGKTYTLTPQNARMTLQAAVNYHNFSGGFFALDADSGTYDGGRFNLEFQTMRSISQLQAGFYDWAQRYPFHNTAFGGLTLTSNRGGCNWSTGWMVLDKVAYLNGKLSAIHGRFEQYCDGDALPLHGEFNWEG